MPAERAAGRPAAKPSPRGERLQKVMAHAGIAARRKCEEYILAGRVKVNGKVVTELGTRVDPDKDLVEFDGTPVVAQERKRLYYLLYKPVGYLSTVSDPHGRPTALSLVPGEERLYPVGRLDLESEGLLLFTNDGSLSYRLMHPRFEHEKEYFVLIKGALTDRAIEQLAKGVHIGEKEVFVRAQVQRLDPEWRWRREAVPPGCSWVRVILREGQKRQIRYMLQNIGYEVERLIRVRMGELTLGNLKPGQGRWLSHEEARALRRFAGLERAEAHTENATRKAKVETHHDRYRRPGGVGQEHRRRRAGG